MGKKNYSGMTRKQREALAEARRRQRAAELEQRRARTRQKLGELQHRAEPRAPHTPPTETIWWTGVAWGNNTDNTEHVNLVNPPPMAGVPAYEPDEAQRVPAEFVAFDEDAPLPAPAYSNEIGRRYYYSDGVAHPLPPGEYPAGPGAVIQVGALEEANLIGSMVHPGVHAPVLDLDFPCQLVPSTTPGHFHLYLDTLISWDQYRNVLTALMNAGLIEQGFRDTALNQGFSAVRPPGVLKPGAGGLLPEMTEPTDTGVARAVVREKDQVIQAQNEEIETLRNELARREQLRTWS